MKGDMTMKELIPMNEYGLFADKKETARVSSLYVAEAFEKRHDNILRDIKELLDPKSGLSEGFGLLNFEESSYLNSQNKRQPCYMLTRDGFTMLVMGYTGEKAMRFKELYISRFNEMEAQIKELLFVRKEFPEITRYIKMSHESPQPYHYSNEANLLYLVSIGKTAKQYREDHDLEKGENIRPHLKKEQLMLLERLQHIDVGLLIAGLSYSERKKKLEACKPYEIENIQKRLIKESKTKKQIDN